MLKYNTNKTAFIDITLNLRRAASIRTKKAAHIKTWRPFLLFIYFLLSLFR